MSEERKCERDVATERKDKYLFLGRELTELVDTTRLFFRVKLKLDGYHV